MYSLEWCNRYSGTEEIETDIATLEEANFLQKEYSIAFSEGLVKIKEVGFSH